MPSTSSDFAVPSALWCHWQAFKGMNPAHLRIPDADLRGKNVVVTGGNNGIGREAALQFAKWGANVTIACRHPPPHERHPDEVVRELQVAASAAGHDKTTLEWLHCDMSDFSSVESFADLWLAKNKPLDYLANNAGMNQTVGDQIITKNGFEIVHQVNFMSHVLLTMKLLPSLEKAREPRVICTTSCMQYLGKIDLENINSGKDSYPNNKLFYQIWLTEFQARVLKNPDLKHITIQGIHPGFVNSGIWNAIQDARQNATLSWVGWFLLSFLNLVSIDTQQGSLAITNAATAVSCGPDPAIQDVGSAGGKGGGRYFNRLSEEIPMPQTRSEFHRQQIWQYVEKHLGLDTKGLSNYFKT